VRGKFSCVKARFQLSCFRIVKHPVICTSSRSRGRKYQVSLSSVLSSPGVAFLPLLSMSRRASDEFRGGMRHSNQQATATLLESSHVHVTNISTRKTTQTNKNKADSYCHLFNKRLVALCSPVPSGMTKIYSHWKYDQKLFNRRFQMYPKFLTLLSSGISSVGR
jgi:hypothetical protein